MLLFQSWWVKMIKEVLNESPEEIPPSTVCNPEEGSQPIKPVCVGFGDNGSIFYWSTGDKQFSGDVLYCRRMFPLRM